MTDQPRPMTMTRLGAISDGAIQPTHDDIATLCDLAAEALGHRDAQDAIGDWLEKVDQFEADVRRIEQASEDRGIDWLHDLLCDVDYPGQPPEGVMP